jgi:hypothetical protein
VSSEDVQSRWRGWLVGVWYRQSIVGGVQLWSALALVDERPSEAVRACELLSKDVGASGRECCPHKPMHHTLYLTYVPPSRQHGLCYLSNAIQTQAWLQGCICHSRPPINRISVPTHWTFPTSYSLKSYIDISTSSHQHAVATTSSGSYKADFTPRLAPATLFRCLSSSSQIKLLLSKTTFRHNEHLPYTQTRLWQLWRMGRAIEIPIQHSNAQYSHHHEHRRLRHMVLRQHYQRQQTVQTPEGKRGSVLV